MKAWVASLAVLSLPFICSADENSNQRPYNWHQWRGPDATGFAPRGDPPLRWDEQTNIKWKVPIPGLGTSTPIVWGDRIFLLTAIEVASPDEPSAASDDDRRREPSPHQFVVLCLDRESGSVLWQQTACEVVPHQRHHPTSSFASASPVTNGRYVYCSFGSRGVYCYDMEGIRQWRRDLGQFDIKYSFGEGSSPALYEDTLIVNCDHEGESFITALDAATGEPKWKVPRDENTTWNTPLVTEYDGRVQVIVNGAKAARSYDLATGQLIWEYGGPRGVDAIPSPVRFSDLAICVTGLRGDPAYAVPLRASGDLTDGDLIAWRHDEGTPQIATPTLVGERLYFTKDRAAIVTCLNARTGQAIIDQRRLPAIEDVYPSSVAAAGRVYFTGRNGATVVIDATADRVQLLAENKLDETIVASPAIVGREMLIRGDESLYCLTEK